MNALGVHWFGDGQVPGQSTPSWKAIGRVQVHALHCTVVKKSSSMWRL